MSKLGLPDRRRLYLWSSGNDDAKEHADTNDRKCGNVRSKKKRGNTGNDNGKYDEGGNNDDVVEKDRRNDSVNGARRAEGG